MQWQIHDECTVAFYTESEPILGELRTIFGHHLVEDPASARPPVITLRIRLSDEPFHPPAATPVFVDPQGAATGDFGNLSVYRSPTPGFILYYFSGGLARLRLNPAHMAADVAVSAKMVFSPRFEDVVFTTLAPLLRRCGLFMAHAFAATHGDKEEAALLVGPSGSGKTTTGLKLLLNGWRLLANDVVLLREQGESIVALPTPGVIAGRRPALDFIPELRRFTGKSSSGNVRIKSGIIKRWSAPATIKAIYFPTVSTSGRVSCVKERGAVALALLMEESLDRWDLAFLEKHTALLSRLVAQANVYRLALGLDLDQIVTLIE